MNDVVKTQRGSTVGTTLISAEKFICLVDLELGDAGRCMGKTGVQERDRQGLPPAWVSLALPLPEGVAPQKGGS